MKQYILTIDSERNPRIVESYATQQAAFDRLDAFMERERESQCLDLSDVPERSMDDWGDAWEYIMQPMDMAWIDEVTIPGEAIIPGANPDAMELHEIAKTLEHAITYDVFNDAPEYESAVDDVISSMEQAADALRRAGRMIEAKKVTRIWAIASDGRDGTDLEFFRTESECDDRVWEMITPAHDWNDDDSHGDDVDPAEYRARFSDWGEAMEHYTPDGLTFAVDYFDAVTPDAMGTLNNAAGAIYALQDQINQMRGMFPDDDGTIQAALDDGDSVLDEIKAIRNAGKEV